MTGPADTSTPDTTEPPADAGGRDRAPEEDTMAGKKVTGNGIAPIPGGTHDLEVVQAPPAYWMRSVDDHSVIEPAFSYGAMMDKVQHRMEVMHETPEGMPAATGVSV